MKSVTLFWLAGLGLLPVALLMQPARQVVAEPLPQITVSSESGSSAQLEVPEVRESDALRTDPLPTAEPAPVMDWKQEYDELETLYSKVASEKSLLQQQYDATSIRLILCENASPSVTHWTSQLLPTDILTPGELDYVCRLLVGDFEGVMLSREEGLWIVERARLNDWGSWSRVSQWIETTSHGHAGVIIPFLGWDRIKREVSPEKLQGLIEASAFYDEETWELVGYKLN